MSVIIGLPATGIASPKDDLNAVRSFFKERFPNVKFEDYKMGLYALDKDRQEAWKEFEDFAPAYDDAVELGKTMFDKPFKNGKSYASCFENGGIGIRQNYPLFDTKSGKLVTLEGAINACREDNGEEKLGWSKGKIAAISAYMAFTSRGKKINIKVPNDPRALAAFEDGKKTFFAKRGQLNFSCADCHIFNAGNLARSNQLSAVIGQVAGFPVWRKKWATSSKSQSDVTRGLGTLHRRYGGCNKQVRAKPMKSQSDAYKNLEYFHQYLSNGVEVLAPSTRM